MSKLLLSIICPVYNSELFLEDCILSVVNQTDKDWELVLIDDGSTDNSGIICDHFSTEDNRIKIIHKNNGGQMQARIDGIKSASGSHIVFLDSDDLLDRKAVEVLKKTIIDKNVDAIVFNGKVFPSSNKKLPFVESDTVFIGDKEIANFLFGQQMFGYLWMYCFKKEIFDTFIKNGQTLLNIRYTEDTYFIYNCSLLFKTLLSMKEVLYYYRDNSNSITHSLSNRDRYERFLVFDSIYSDLYHRYSDFCVGNLVLDRNSWAMISYLEHINDIKQLKSAFLEVKRSCIYKLSIKNFWGLTRTLKKHIMLIKFNFSGMFFKLSHK